MTELIQGMTFGAGFALSMLILFLMILVLLRVSSHAAREAARQHEADVQILMRERNELDAEKCAHLREITGSLDAITDAIDRMAESG